MSIAALIVAGGIGKRFQSDTPKQFFNFQNDIIINHSIKKFLKIQKISNIIITIEKKTYSKYKSFIPKNKKIIITNSGKTRALSVLNGLKKAKKLKITKILIHDAARPFFSEILINKLIKLLKHYDCIIPAVNPVDTITYKKNIISKKEIFKIQTPQAFDFNKLYTLHTKNHDKYISDESSLFFKNNFKVKIIKGEYLNKKITYKNDLPNETSNNFYGIGYDIHKMVNNRKLIIGGVTIPHNMGPEGHSDGDSLLHALIDSFLGAAKKGDIGTLFPNTAKYKNIKSSLLLKKTISILKKEKLKINSIDLNIILQQPNLKNYKEKIRNNLAKMCKIKKDKINIKAKTTDRLGIIGKNKALACEVISTLCYERSN